VTTSPGVHWALRPAHAPCGETTHGEQQARDRGTRDKGRPPRGPGGSRRVAYGRCTGASEAQAPPGREGDVGQSVPAGTIHERDAERANRVTPPPLDSV
jgi:hypothetical protein